MAEKSSFSKTINEGYSCKGDSKTLGRGMLGGEPVTSATFIRVYLGYLQKL